MQRLEVHRLRASRQALAATQLALAREQKLTDLGGVVAATAHELGTPLATIKLVSSELMHALKGQPDAEIRVTAEPGPEPSVLHVVVADNGPGMDEETRRRCFEPFFSTKRRQLSTGLGLAVCRTIVQAHGGEIRVEPGTSRGVSFVIELPTAPSDAHA